MSLVQASIWTVNPSDPWTPLNWFNYTDPFGMALSVQLDPSLSGQGLDATYSVVNPRQDPFKHAWFTFFGDSLFPMPTIDNDWLGIQYYPNNSFLAIMYWPQYASFASQVAGPDSTEGLFYARGEVRVGGSAYFAVADPFWFRVVNIGVITQE